MTAETIADLVARRKRIFTAVTTKIVTGLSARPELAARVTSAAEKIMGRPDGFWFHDFHPKTDATNSVALMCEIVIENELKAAGLTEAESDALADAAYLEPAGVQPI